MCDVQSCEHWKSEAGLRSQQGRLEVEEVVTAGFVLLPAMALSCCCEEVCGRPLLVP
jgi:hypothetical protein